MRKAEQRELENASSGMVMTAATRNKSAPVLPEVVEYKDPRKRKRRSEEVKYAFAVALDFESGNPIFC